MGTAKVFLGKETVLETGCVNAQEVLNWWRFTGTSRDQPQTGRR